MSNLSTEVRKRIKSDAAKQQAQDEQTHEIVKAELQEAITGLKKSIQEKVAADREKEQEFRKVRLAGKV